MSGAQGETAASRRSWLVCVTAIVSTRDAGIVGTRGIFPNGTQYGVDAIRTEGSGRARYALLADQILVLLRLAPTNV